MTDPHATSKAVYAMECENRVLRDVLDSVFKRGVMLLSEKNRLAGLLHDDDTLTQRSIAKTLVKTYGDMVKSPADPNSAKRDVSRTQAIRNVEKLLETGLMASRLAVAIEAAGRYYNLNNRAWEYRPNCGNFFGMKAVYMEFLPEQAEAVPDAEKAETIKGLFDGEVE